MKEAMVVGVVFIVGVFYFLGIGLEEVMPLLDQIFDYFQSIFSNLI